MIYKKKKKQGNEEQKKYIVAPIHIFNFFLFTT